MEHHSLAIDEKGTVVADLHLAEAHFRTTDIDGLSLCVLQHKYEVVEVRLLRAPEFRGTDVHSEGEILSRDSGGLAGNTNAILFYPGFQGTALNCFDATKRHFNLSLGTGEGGVEHCCEKVVANLTLGSRPEETRAVDTRQSPIVLTFQERSASETIDLQCYGILALSQIGSDVEFRRQVRVLAIAYTLAVYPKIVAVTHAVESNVHVAASPVGGNGEGAPIGSDGIGHTAVIGKPTRAVGHHRVSAFVERERIGHIAVKWFVPRLAVAQAPDLPTGRHVDVGPRCVVVVLGAIIVLRQ